MTATLDEALVRFRDGPEFTGLRLVAKRSRDAEEDRKVPQGQEGSLLVMTLENPLTTDDMEKLFQAVACFPRLANLQLYNQNQICERGWIIFGRILSNNLPVKSLALRKCDITDQVFPILMVPLMSNRHLTELDLSGNSLKESLRPRFAQHFGDSSTLNTLDLSNNQLWFQDAHALGEVIRGSSTEKRIILHGNKCVASAQGTHVEALAQGYKAYAEQAKQIASGEIVSSRFKVLPSEVKPLEAGLAEPAGDVHEEDEGEEEEEEEEDVEEEEQEPARFEIITPPFDGRPQFERTEAAVPAPTLLDRKAPQESVSRAEKLFQQKYGRPDVDKALESESHSALASSSHLSEVPEFLLSVEPFGPSQLQIQLRCCAGATWNPFMGRIEVPSCTSLGQIRGMLVSYVEQRACFRRKDLKFLLPCGKEL